MIPYSELGKRNRNKLVDIIPLEKPFTIFIEPTNLCNFRCVQCPHGMDDYAEKAGPLGNMSMECFGKLLTDIREWRKELEESEETPFVKVVRLYLEGEPFVNNEIVEMLRLLKRENIAERVEIITNGSLLTASICKKLVDYQLDYITISIYAIEEYKHKYMTKSNILPQNIIENVRMLRTIRDERDNIRPFIYVKTIDNFNDCENNEFIEAYRGIADEVCIEKPMNWNNSEEVDFISNLYEEEAVVKVKEELGKRPYRKACPYPFHTLSVKSNGDVLVCCVDWKRNTKVGNIREESLYNIWNGKNLYEFRKLHIEGKRDLNLSCNNCELFFKFAEEDNIDSLTIMKLKSNLEKD